MFVAGEVAEPGTGDGSKGSCRLVFCLSLKLERAQGVGHGLFVDPLPDEREQAGRVADHIGKKPVDRAGDRRIQAESAPQTVIDGRHCSHSIGERSLVDAEHAAAHASKNPGPAAGGGAEIQAQIARTGFLTEDSKALPQLEIGAPGRAYLILDERYLAIGEGGGGDGRCQEQILGPERKGAEWRCGGGVSEGQRPAGHMREFLFDEGHPAVASVLIMGVGPPVALDIAQLAGGVADRRDRDPAGGEPGSLSPVSFFLAAREHEPPHDGDGSVSELFEEGREEAAGGHLHCEAILGQSRGIEDPGALSGIIGHEAPVPASVAEAAEDGLLPFLLGRTGSAGRGGCFPEGAARGRKGRRVILTGHQR